MSLENTGQQGTVAAADVGKHAGCLERIGLQDCSDRSPCLGNHEGVELACHRWAGSEIVEQLLAIGNLRRRFPGLDRVEQVSPEGQFKDPPEKATRRLREPETSV